MKHQTQCRQKAQTAAAGLQIFYKSHPYPEAGAAASDLTWAQLNKLKEGHLCSRAFTANGLKDSS